MTRVNLVDPRELSDQHCFAEFRELTRIPKQAWLAIERDGIDAVLARIPPAYVLGKGHVTWAYNKGAFLERRFDVLRSELLRRGFNINLDVVLDEWGVFATDERLKLDYVPTPEALSLNRARLAERVAQRPDWYRFR